MASGDFRYRRTVFRAMPSSPAMTDEVIHAVGQDPVSDSVAGLDQLVYVSI